MRQKRVIIISSLIFILILVFEWFQRDRFRPVKVGYPAPLFRLPLLGGGEVALEDYRGRVIFLNFWATWCTPCVEELPYIEHLYKIFKEENRFKLLTINIDRGRREKIALFAKEYRLTFPILLDPEGRVARLYKTTGVPETFIIGKDGIIVEKVVGPRNWISPLYINKLKGIIEK